jgi:hypothetical protein
VARAKSTDRAEARRKYRAFLQAQEEAAAAAGEQENPATGSTQKSTRGRDVRPDQSARPASAGMFGAARAAYRKPTYIDDLRHIGDLVLRSNAVWPVLILCVVSGLYLNVRVSASDATGDPILPMVYQFVFYPVPLLPPMIAGFLAPRATWLAGLLAALISTVVLVMVVALNSTHFSNSTGQLVSSPSPSAVSSLAAAGSPSASALASTAIAIASATPTATSTSASTSVSPAASPSSSTGTAAAAADTGTTGTPKSATFADILGLAAMLLVQSLGFGAIIGALSGWYKRFLQLSGNPRGSSPRSGGRPSQRRRPATRGQSGR